MGQHMRRSDRQVTGQAALEEIIGRGVACHLALVAQGEPYLVTLNYGYRADTLYFHCATSGKKIDILKACDRVCFSIVTQHELVVGELGCDFSMKYESIVGYGKARFIDEPQQKRQALDIIMAQYAEGSFEYTDEGRTAVFVVDIEQMTGKTNC
jgi:uncharacterized protein